MSTKFSHNQKDYITKLNEMDDLIATLQAQVNALDPDAVVTTPPPEVTVYVTLTEGGTYVTPVGTTSVHHIGDGIAVDPNNVHDIVTYVQHMTTSTASEAAIPEASFDWQANTHVTMDSTRLDSVESWYESAYGPFEFEWCHSGLAWFVCMEGVGHTATNTRVQIRNLVTQYMSESTRQWVQFDWKTAPSPEEWMYPFEPTYAGDGDARSESDANGGGISVKPSYTSGGDKLFNHGYGNGGYIGDPWDWRAVAVSCEFRLIKDNPAGADDRANAVFVVDCGMDLRPGYQNGDFETYHEWPTSWVPGMFNSKILKATSTWRGSGGIVPSSWHGCTYNELLNNPPPMFINVSPGTGSTTVILPDAPTDNQIVKYISVAPIQAFIVQAASGEVGNWTINLAANTEIAFKFRASNSTWYRSY
jgi:hypothetical protein